MYQPMKSADPGGTSFHNITFRANVATLEEAFGPAHYTGDPNDKVQFEWIFESDEDGEVFAVYDWKEHRPIHVNDQIEFHIGHKRESDGLAFLDWLVSEMSKDHSKDEVEF